MTDLRALDAAQPQEVAYCVPFWLRDEQIKQAIARGLPRIEPAYERRSESVAIACYGPSLNDTWDKIRDFPVVISCSGSHRFLVDRGIIPTYHVEVDPRAHKVELMGAPHPGVEYLIASTCHRAMFDHLVGMNVKLWHVFDNKEDGIRTLPHGEWALTGGCSVGLRALTIAGFLGFRDLHVFGMDGSEGYVAQGPHPEGCSVNPCTHMTLQKHAGPHPNQPKGSSACEYDGVTYRTTPALLEAARSTWHELDQMPAVKATFYGEGLVQAMAKHHAQKADGGSKPFANVVGFTKPSLISAEYAALNAQLHRENLAYGVGGGRHAPTVLKLAKKVETQSILDYGCGKGYLAKAIPFPIWEYDPAIPGKEASPRPADLVVCSDVLEHIEPERLKYVLEDLQRCVRRLGYFVIHTGPAGKTLADGRNTHLIQQGQKWWGKRLRKYFDVGMITQKGPELHVVVGPLTLKKGK